MLDIYQGFYQNIWPLKNKSILLNYKKANVLVKAPIWSWKSFLFFDGPIFALYKTSDRTIINKDSKKWQIQLLFSQDDNFFLVVRNLTQTKTWKDSAKTFLYSIVKDKTFVDYLEQIKTDEILQTQQNDILTLLRFNQVQLEDLTTNFKQETELQQTLNDLLPPKEVALSTIFLPQNSENIFEIAPSQRISILKKVFWILWIDDAKKIIDEKKREVYWELKSRENIETYKERFTQVLTSISEYLNKLNFKTGLESFFSEINELGLEKLDINSLKEIKINYDDILSEIKNRQNNYILANEKYENLQEQILEKSKQMLSLQWELKEIDSESSKLVKISDNLEKEKTRLDELNALILKINKKYENLDKAYEKNLKLKTNITQEKQNYEKIILEIEKIQTSIKKLSEKKPVDFDKLEKLKKENEKIKEELSKLTKIDFEFYKFEDKIPKTEKELENLISYIEMEGKTYKQLILKLEADLKDIEDDLKQIIQQESTKKKFFCEKISWDCPFIEQILWDSWNKLLAQQKAKLLARKDKLTKELKQILDKRNYLANYRKEKQISKLLEQLKQIEKLKINLEKNTEELQKYSKMQEEFSHISWQIKQLQANLEDLKKQKQLVQEKIDKLNSSLDSEVFSLYEEYKNLQKEKEKIQNNISDYSKDILKISKLDTEKKNLEKQIKQLENDLTLLKKTKLELEEKLRELKVVYSQSIEDEKYLAQIKEYLWVYNEILKDFNENKIKLLNLKNKYNILKDLSNIFGKELVIYVFSDYLQSLEELINYFISDIVNFTLHIQLDEKWENLDIFVEDEYWRRPVSSLSWWQKTALRIWWILWISKLQNAKMLFLDETINNFDQDSVQLIASKIKEFVQSNDMKFYMITHSEILQQSDIWTDIVELKI